MTQLSQNNAMTVLGVMSGTSLDGLDLALCVFEKNNQRVTFEIQKAVTFPYAEIWKQRLSSVADSSAEKYFAMNALYGQYIAEKINEFLGGQSKPDAVASHGHTIFHQPAAGFSTQIGCGATIAANTGILTVNDFRSLDVALGGQGAPLVPIGDKLLFGDYQACLNLGGIANISYDDAKGERVAFDVSICNMLLNYLAETTGEPFDRGGKMARQGKADKALLETLNGLGFYQQRGAKSIGREWFTRHVLPHFEKSSLPLNDQLATATEHIAQVLAETLKAAGIRSVLVTGGGAYNVFLLERLKSLIDCEIIVPGNDLVNFKEALIFAFLGYLRLQGEINAFSSVTGATKNSCGGAVYRPA